MKESYVSYEQARKLKECGFEWECNDVYPANLPDNAPFNKMLDAGRYFHLTGESLFIQTLYPATSLSLAQKWLRDVKGIAINVIAHDGGKWAYDIVFLPNNDMEYDAFDIDRSPWCRAYEEALEEGIDTVLNLLTEKQ